MAVSDELFQANADAFVAEAQMLAIDVATATEIDAETLHVAQPLGELASMALTLHALAETATEATVEVEYESETPLASAETAKELPLAQIIVAYLEAHAGTWVSPAQLRALDPKGGNESAIRQRYGIAMRSIKADPRYATCLAERGKTSTLQYGFSNPDLPTGFQVIEVPLPVVTSETGYGTKSHRTASEHAANAEAERGYARAAGEFFKAHPWTLLKQANFTHLDPAPPASYSERSARFHRARKAIMRDPEYAGRIKKDGQKNGTRYWYTDDPTDETVPRVSLADPSKPPGFTPTHRQTPSTRGSMSILAAGREVAQASSVSPKVTSERVDTTPVWKVEINSDGTGTLDGSKTRDTLALQVVGVVAKYPDGICFDDLQKAINELPGHDNEVTSDALVRALKYISAWLPSQHAAQWNDEVVMPENSEELPDRILKIVPPEDADEDKGTKIRPNAGVGQIALQLVSSNSQNSPSKLAQAMNPVAWIIDAACRGTDGDAFFPESSTLLGDVSSCEGCPVINECLDRAITNREPHGIWGGLLFKQLKEVRDLLDEGNKLSAVEITAVHREENWRLSRRHRTRVLPPYVQKDQIKEA